MEIIYKSLFIALFAILISACDNSTSTNNTDKNITQNLNFVEDNNETSDVVEDNNETSDVVEDNNETSDVLEDNNETSDVVEDNNETSDVVEDNNETSDVVEDNNETSDVVEDNNETSDVVEDNNETSDVVEDNNETTDVVEDNNETTDVVEDNNETSDVVEDNNETSDAVEDNNETTNIGTIYEDAENQKTDKWIIISNHSKKANILNTYDDDTNSRVIYLDAKIEGNNKKSYDSFKFNGIDSNKSNKYIKWDMKFNQKFTISINISTDKGERWIQYIAKDTGAGIYGERIVHGIGSDKTNNEWHTITRDLESDVKRYEQNNNFIHINYIIVQGGGYIDNITSFSIEDNLEINKPVIISKPGIVLTFDDSYVKNWNHMQSTFKEKGAVATFFCNRWASNQNWNLPDEEIRLLKSFRDNGHEIAYHTSDHISTRDHKYDNEANKAKAYLDEQIIPGVVYMRNKGFEPTSFSYPYMSEQPAHNALIRQELPHIRAFFAHVTLTDDPGNISLDEIRTHLEKLKRDKDIGVFLSHWIHYKGKNDVESANERHKYKISEEKLIKIIDMVNELGLEFYTLSEAHNIYMNQ